MAMHHIPGNNPNKRRIPAPEPQTHEPKIQAYFAEESFIPARGQCLIECRFLGHSDTIILDHLHDQQQYAIVRAVGEPRMFATGVEIPNEIAVGDFVYAAIGHPNARRVELNNRKMVILPMEAVIGKFREMPESVLKAIKAQEEREAAATETQCNGAQPPPAE